MSDEPKLPKRGDQKRMSNLLDGIPSQSQRQDSAITQLYDLVRVANRLGMHDAADAIKKAFGVYPPHIVRYGCHCELESTISGEPDDCVINYGAYEDCIHARRGMRPEQCEHWRPVSED